MCSIIYSSISSLTATKISGLKESVDYKEWPKDEDDEPLKSKGPELLTGFVRKPTRADILASIPPKPVVDALISQLFDSGDIIISITPRVLKYGIH